TRQWDVVRSVAFSPDGKMLVSASDDGVLSRHDPATGRVVETFTARRAEAGEGTQGGNSGAFFRLEFGADSRTLLAANGDQSVKFWDVEGWKLLPPLAGHTDCVFSASFTPDGKSV